MTLDEARAALGVTAQSSPEEVRATFLRRVRTHHPDVTDNPVGAGERTATIIAAYRLLRDRPAEPEASPAGAGAPCAQRHDSVEVISDEAVWVDAPGPLVGRVLLDVADVLGDVSYVDRSNGLVQVTVRPEGGPTCWLTVSLHPRPGGTVLVATLESIESAPAPAAGPLVRTLADELAARLREIGEIAPEG